MARQVKTINARQGNSRQWMQDKARQVNACASSSTRPCSCSCATCSPSERSSCPRGTPTKWALRPAPRTSSFFVVEDVGVLVAALLAADWSALDTPNATSAGDAGRHPRRRRFRRRRGRNVRFHRNFCLMWSMHKRVVYGWPSSSSPGKLAAHGVQILSKSHAACVGACHCMHAHTHTHTHTHLTCQWTRRRHTIWRSAIAPRLTWIVTNLPRHHT